MQYTPTPPSLSYPLGQEREHLAHVESNSVATKEKVKATTWLNQRSIQCPWLAIWLCSLNLTNMLSSPALGKANYAGGEKTQYLDSLNST